MAILRHELHGLATTWLVRLWLVGSAVLALLILTSNWATRESAPLFSAVLFPYLVFPWCLIVIAMSISPVTGSRVEALADGFLSRPVTRYEFLLAAWAARVIVVLSVFLIVTLPIALLVTYANRPVGTGGITLYGIGCALIVVSLVLTLLVSLGFLLGTLLRHPMLAAMMLIFIWLPINFVFATFKLEQFSPVSLNESMTTLLRKSWSDEDNPDVTASMENVGQTISQLMTDPFGRRTAAVPQHRERDFFNSRDYDDFSLLRVLLGYGIPTLLSIGLATLVFSRRDL